MKYGTTNIKPIDKSPTLENSKREGKNMANTTLKYTTSRIVIAATYSTLKEYVLRPNGLMLFFRAKIYKNSIPILSKIPIVKRDKNSLSIGIIKPINSKIKIIGIAIKDHLNADQSPPFLDRILISSNNAINIIC
ncbi:MAG TPA: hypothetical protein VJJ52_03305 [Candidatus Nanoarchaeia archaeon]|nr:hypothetical protein [Candidatus Nanoarchaeia archaeon]